MKMDRKYFNSSWDQAKERIDEMQSRSEGTIQIDTQWQKKKNIYIYIFLHEDIFKTWREKRTVEWESMKNQLFHKSQYCQKSTF